MDTNDTIERLQKTEEDFGNRLRAVEAKLQILQQIAWVIGAVALIFGVSGAWGLKLLRDAEAELDDTDKRVVALSKKTQEMEPFARQQIESLRLAGAEVLKQFREDAKREADLAAAKIRTDFSKEELQTRALKIVNASGQTLVSLSAGSGGGEVKIFGTTNSVEPIAFVGVTGDGDSVLHLSDRSGREMLRGMVGGSGGSFSTYNASNGKQVATFGASADGSGGFWLSDKSGREALSGSASDTGGRLYSSNPESGKVVASIGSSIDGSGGF